jgi:hypothetical protein
MSKGHHGVVLHEGHGVSASQYFFRKDSGKALSEQRVRGRNRRDLGSPDEQSVQIFPQLAVNHPPGSVDVRKVPAIASECRSGPIEKPR